jgi:DNA-binding CsgD family transcriptional regulator
LEASVVIKGPDPELVGYRREAIIEMTRAGRSIADIAAHLGVTERTVIRHRKAAGISRPAIPAMTAGEIETARTLLEDGASYSEVGRTIGRNPKTLQLHFPGFGWTQAQASEYRHMRQELDRLGCSA